MPIYRYFVLLMFCRNWVIVVVFVDFWRFAHSLVLMCLYTSVIYIFSVGAIPATFPTKMIF